MLFLLTYFFITNTYPLLIAPPSSAENFVDRSSEIVIAKLVKKESFEKNKQILSSFRIKISKIIKRTYLAESQKYLDIIMAGGTIGNKSLTIGGMYSLKKEQEYVLFLIRKKNYWKIASSNDGCYKIENNNEEEQVFPCSGRLSSSNIFFKEVIINTKEDNNIQNFIKKIKGLMH